MSDGQTTADLAQHIVITDGVLDRVLNLYAKLAQDTGLPFEDLFGDRESLREVLTNMLAEVYTEHFDERLLRWQARQLEQPEARELRAKVATIHDAIELTTQRAIDWNRALTVVKQYVRRFPVDVQPYWAAACASESDDPEGDVARFILDKAEASGWQLAEIADRPGLAVRQVVTSMKRQET